jgi:hypothetical protein
LLCFRISVFAAVEVVAIIRAPKTRANCSAKTETPPEPCVKNVSPAVARRWPVSATHAVTAAHGNVAQLCQAAVTLIEAFCRSCL